ncbi:hypothetical protein [Bacillus sp. REN3]|uniref:hypothetical protein n=1 Tax=Bacillus sp. REN3 TaxID=2802440 RepID=UPI0032C04807
MSFPRIPNITPTISITTAQTIPLLLSSIAFEELALAHIMNAEAEKLQLILGTLPGSTTLTPSTVSLQELLDVDADIQRTLGDVIKKEMLLEFKFENILDLIGTIIPPTPPTPPIPPEAFCECGARFSTPSTQPTIFISSASGPGTGRITNISSQGAIEICGSGSCQPDKTNLFDFVFAPLNPAIPGFKFIVTAYTLTDGALATCCTLPDGRLRMTLTGTGLKNGQPATFTLVLIEGIGQADDVIILTIDGETFFTPVDQGPGQPNVQVFPCGGQAPPPCPD